MTDIGNSASTADRHEHTAVTTYLLRRRSGIPYEVEQRVCAACRRVLDERPVRRAAA